MHSRIFQVSKSPIKKELYIDSADYVGDTSRSESIKWLAGYFGDSVEVDPDKITIKNKLKYFEAPYVKFCKTLDSLRTASLRRFAVTN